MTARRSLPGRTARDGVLGLGAKGSTSRAPAFVVAANPEKVSGDPRGAPEPSTDVFWVVLPYPPTVNTLWRRVGNSTLLSAEGRAYHKQVGVIVRQVDLTRVPKPPHAVEIIAYVPDRRRRDVDNILKCILDPLYRAIGLDDSVVERLSVEKRWPALFGASVVVTIAPARHGAGEGE